jgi:hypothetical protein
MYLIEPFITVKENIKIVTFVNCQKEMLNFEAARSMISISHHKMSSNYSIGFNSNEIIAYTNGYVDNELEMCSSISRNVKWPPGVYRILNRLFKPFVTDVFTKKIDQIWVEMIKNQILFSNNHISDFETGIITRKVGYKNSLITLKNVLNNQGLDFKIWNSEVWTCNDKTNKECLQNIISIGKHIEEKLF